MADLPELVDLGALWEKDGKFSGKIGNARVLILPNKNRQKDTHPTHRILVSNPIKKEKKEEDLDF